MLHYDDSLLLKIVFAEYNSSEINQRYKKSSLYIINLYIKNEFIRWS